MFCFTPGAFSITIIHERTTLPRLQGTVPTRGGCMWKEMRCVKMTCVVGRGISVQPDIWQVQG